jgi:hypothetical protein
MKKLQKALGFGAVLFVFIYLSAIVVTVKSRIEKNDRPTVVESQRSIERERHLLLPELLLPMAILLALAGSYLIVRRRNERLYEKLDDDIDEGDT